MMPNNKEKKNKGGRPPKWEKPEDLEKEIGDYFKHCDEKRKKPTKGGLAIHLDTTAETLSDYEEKKKFSEAIKRAYGLIEDAWVQRLDKNAATGAIFYLKNAFWKQYKDRKNVDVTSGGEKIEGFNYISPDADSDDKTD